MAKLFVSFRSKLSVFLFIPAVYNINTLPINANGSIRSGFTKFNNEPPSITPAVICPISSLMPIRSNNSPINM